MTASFFLPRDRIVDANGIPVAGARVRFFAVTTTTPKAVYSDQGLTTPISQPVTADSGGLLPMIYYGTGLYKVRISDASDGLIYETDNVDPGLGAVAAALPISAGGTGATTAATARDNLEVPSQAEMDALALNFSDLETSVDTEIAAVALTTGTPSPLGLLIAVTSNTAATITAAEVVVSTGTALRRLTTVSVGVDIAVSGANGLDSGSEASNTFYFVFVIYNPTTDTKGALLSTSPSAPVLPSGYTYFRRVGAIRNNSGSNLYRTRQNGPFAMYVYGTNPSSAITIASGVATSNTSVAGFIPSTAFAIYVQATGITDNSGASTAIGDNSSQPGFLVTSTTTENQTFSVPTMIYLSGTTIYYSSNAGSSAGLVALGWLDAI